MGIGSTPDAATGAGGQTCQKYSLADALEEEILRGEITTAMASRA
jgi:hypothetical protein